MKLASRLLGFNNILFFLDLVSIARIGTMHAWETELLPGGKSDLRIDPV
jgi:hypothetical protein